MSGSESIVLLPGLLDDRRMWDTQVQSLADEADVVALDLDSQTTVAEGAVNVLDAVPGQLALVGFSMGGYVSLEIFRQAPERVSRLALIDTSARADDAAKKRARHQQIELAQSGGYASLVDDAIPTVIHPSRLQDDVLVSTLRTMALRIGPQAYIRQQQTCMSRPDSRDMLSSITCPSIIVCGREDTLTPPSLSYELGKALEAPVILIDECNHYTPLEQPHALTALLRGWLQMK